MGPRSSGCITCRIRKIKCDQGRPSCRKCTSTGRKCDGYSALPFSREDLRTASQSQQQTDGTAGLIPCLVSNTTLRDVTERRYFQFFRTCTVEATNLTVDSRFWDRLVLQACDAEPAIKHAVLALAAFHNSLIECDARHVAQHHLAYAERQYQLALGQAQTLVDTASSQQINRVLMVCMLFIIYEGLRGNYAASKAHMDSGIAIVAQCQQAGPTASNKNHFDEIIEVFARLDVLAISFSDDSSPYHNKLSDLKKTAQNLFPSPFDTIRQAHASLTDILRWILMLENHIRIWKDYDDIVAFTSWMSLEKCQAALSKWRQCWNDMLAAPRAHVDSRCVQSVEIWYNMALAISKAGFGDAESRYDCAHNQFLRIVELGEALFMGLGGQNQTNPSFSLDLGFIVPIFFCAIRCRHPQTRRRAADVLALYPRREGTWESTVAAAIAIRWIHIEEEGLGEVQKAEQVPEISRITILRTWVDTQHSAAKLRFIKSVSTSSVNAFREEDLHWANALDDTKRILSVDYH